jgi:hypothetical protein
VSKKKATRAQAHTDSATIAELKRAVEALVSGSKKPQELEGIIADARVLAREWKIKEPGGHWRPLFDSIANNTTLLLAALVVALRRDHELIEHIRRYFPGELDELYTRSWLAFLWKAAQNREVTARERSELKRSGYKLPGGVGLIEHEFGGGGEADWRKLASLSGLPYQPTCLDGIFAGHVVKMHDSEGEASLIWQPHRIRRPGLQRLFGMNRHRLGKIVQGGRKKRRYDWRDVVNIMSSLLSKDPREKRKKSKPGRPEQVPWLNDADLRTRVLSGIKARLTSIPVKKKIAMAFLAVLQPPDLGTK